MKNFLSTGHFLVWPLACLLIFAACEDEAPEVVDTTKPVIANVQHPEVVEAGSVFQLSFLLQDELALGEVRLNIHNSFDGHAHERVGTTATPFSYDNILADMEGKKTFTVQEEIPIPEGAATGEYHLQIRYLDAAGNEGDLYVSSFIIESEQAPVISITNFEAGEDLEVNENGILVLQGIVESRTDGGLEEVHIMVTEEGEEHSHGRIKHDGDHLYEQEWMLNGAPSFVFEEEIDPAIDPSEAVPGHYLLTITAKGVAGNTRTLERGIHVE